MTEENKSTRDFTEVETNDLAAGIVEKRGLEIIAPVTTDPVPNDVAIAYISGTDPGSAPATTPSEPTTGQDAPE